MRWLQLMLWLLVVVIAIHLAVWLLLVLRLAHVWMLAVRVLLSIGMLLIRPGSHALLLRPCIWLLQACVAIHSGQS